MPAYAADVALLELLAGPRAADAVRAPFVPGDCDNVVKRFRDAGAGSVEIGTPKGAARFPSIRVMIEADLRGSLPVTGVELNEDQIAGSLKEAEGGFRDHVGTDGRM